MAKYGGNYRNVLGVPDEEPPEPKIKEQFSWDEFLGGFAKGALGGYGAGIDMGKAREAAIAAEYKAMQANPEPFLSEYDRRFGPKVDPLDNLPTTPIAADQIPGLDMPPTGSLPDLASVGVPERTTPQEMGAPVINLVAAKEARDRELSKSRYVFSDAVEQKLRKVKDKQLELLHQEDLRAEKEVAASGLKTAMDTYVKANARMDILLNERDQAEADWNDAKKSGSPNTIDHFARQYQTILDAISKVKEEGRTAEAALVEFGIPKTEYNELTDPTKRTSSQRSLLRKYAGTTRVRTPGTK
jgi:hypothetical protein